MTQYVTILCDSIRIYYNSQLIVSIQTNVQAASPALMLDAGYHYRCLYVALSVHVVTTVSRVKMAELIAMPFRQ